MTIPDEILKIIAFYAFWLNEPDPERVAEIFNVGPEVHAELERELKKLRPGRYTTTPVETVLAQYRSLIEAAAEKYGQRMGEAIRAIHEAAARRGRESLERQLEAWDAEERLPPKPGSSPPTPPPADPPPPPAPPDDDSGPPPRRPPRPRRPLADEFLDPGLLDYHEASVKAYGEEMIAKMRRSLSRGVMANETIAQTAERMAAEFDMEVWRAERIVRTEQSFAFHRRQILDLIDEWGDEAETLWGKQLLAVHDDRTGDDSKFVDLQIQRLLDVFKDNEGREYQHPPNRPNDREKMVFVPMREVERFEELASDPSNGGNIGPNSRREAQVALGIERAIARGEDFPGVTPPFRRSPDPQADFIDDEGQAWDVKGFVSNPPPGEDGAFTLEHSIRKMKTKIDKGIKVIVDTARMSPEHVEELRNRVQALNWGDQVVYFIP